MIETGLTESRVNESGAIETERSGPRLNESSAIESELGGPRVNESGAIQTERIGPRVNESGAIETGRSGPRVNESGAIQTELSGPRQIESDKIRGQENEGGSSLGSRAPKGRVPLIRPRRDRIMGSSILASLSEAGGNDPFHLVSGPLPPHILDVADRVGTRPTLPLVQLDCLFIRPLDVAPLLNYQHVSRSHTPRISPLQGRIRNRRPSLARPLCALTLSSPDSFPLPEVRQFEKSAHHDVAAK
jgi:hypothetical protein